MRKKLKLDELNRLTIDQFKQSKKFPIAVVCDNIRSAMNIGSFFRTADSLAIEKLVLCGISATPPHKEINKTAIGATESVVWEYEKDILQAIQNLKDAGYKIIAIEQTSDSIPLQEYFPMKDQKYALVFGNEVNGVSAEVVNRADLALEIPQFGTKHSFNVAVCGGIVIWNFVKDLMSD